MPQRYAIYLAPPAGSDLEALARQWLGRDHISGSPVTHLAPKGISVERLEQITQSPRHYGFHATLKAPFELAEGQSLASMIEFGAGFAAERKPFDLPLYPASLSGFLALVPKSASTEIDDLAADCVEGFEPFRRPLSPEDVARRRRSTLTPRQDAQMLKWGYPYVFEDFRFHMTLTERLDEPERDQVLTTIRALAAPVLDTPMRVTEVAIYHQIDRASPFTLLERLPFRSL